MEDKQPTRAPRGWPRVWVLLAVGLALAAIVALYASVPPPTVLAVHVVDSATGTALDGAQVTARLPGNKPLPVVSTGDDGIARFEFLEGQAGYRVDVQKVDYDFRAIDGVTVAGEQETVLPVRLVHRPGGRLFVGLEGARVVQVDVASLIRIQTIVLPVPSASPVGYLRLHPTLDLLYVVAGNQAQILSSLTGATLAPLGVPAAAIDGLEVSADGEYVLVAGLAEMDTTGISQQRHLWFVDAQNGTLISDTILSRTRSRLEVEWQPDGMDTSVLMATDSGVDRATVSSPGAGRLGNVAFRARGYPDRLNLSATGEYLYAWVSGMYSSERGEYLDSLVLVSTADGLAVYQEVPRGVVALASSPVKEELFVLNQDLGTLALIDLTGEGRQGLSPVGKRPAALTVGGDGARVYVADQGDPAVVVVDVATMRVVASIPLPAAPLSLAVR